jgi:putative redox protein
MATEIKIKNIPEGYQSFISNGRHGLVGDEPVNSKGTDLGFAPPEFLLSAISMCKVSTIRNVARRNGWVIGNVNAHVKQTVRRDRDGKFTTSVDSAIDIEGDISEEQRAELVHEADNCYITRLVRGEWIINESTTLVSEESGTLEV